MGFQRHVSRLLQNYISALVSQKCFQAYVIDALCYAFFFQELQSGSYFEYFAEKVTLTGRKQREGWLPVYDLHYN